MEEVQGCRDTQLCGVSFLSLFFFPTEVKLAYNIVLVSTWCFCKVSLGGDHLRASLLLINIQQPLEGAKVVKISLEENNYKTYI